MKVRSSSTLDAAFAYVIPTHIRQLPKLTDPKGHDGIIHGGLLATILDEALARTAFMNLPSKIGVTANLDINYKLPTKADQFIVVKTRIAEVKGRKATVIGQVEDLNGKILVEVK